MGFKLTKDEKATRTRLLGDLDSGWKKLETEQANAQTAIQQILDDFAGEVGAFQAVVSEAESFRNDVAERLRGEWDDKSEGWQEGDNGQSASSFVEEWENASFEVEFETPDVDLSIEGDGVFSELEQLPEEQG